MSVYFSEEQNLLREQIRRFIDEEVKPHGEKWEEVGMVPRDVLRKMGELGFLGHWLIFGIADHRAILGADAQEALVETALALRQADDRLQVEIDAVPPQAVAHQIKQCVLVVGLDQPQA